jgi:iron(II)-dependent oxidoreductase
LNFNFGVGDTSRVGQYQNGASHYGIFDMAGNVWEWVSDFYDENYYPVAPTQNPKGPSSGVGRSFRGGGFGNVYVDEVRATYRGGTGPDTRSPAIGIRCASSP